MQQFGQHHGRDAERVRLGVEADPQSLWAIPQNPDTQIGIKHIAQQLERLARLCLRLVALSQVDAGGGEKVIPNRVLRDDYPS
jgi:hypothetical protein